MNRHLKTFLAACGVMLIAVVGLEGASYAATGKPFLLGKSNSASRTTTLTNTGAGAVLSLHASRTDRPALAVDTNVLIPHLNADMLDGKHAAQLQTKSYSISLTSGTSSTSGVMTVPISLPAGRYALSYSVFMSGAYGSTSAPINPYCYVVNPSFSAAQVYGQTVNTGYTSAGVSASGLFASDGNTHKLYCYSGGQPWSFASVIPSTVTAVRLDNNTVQSVTPGTSKVAQPVGR